MSYIIDGERRFLISGEFHYFRVPQADWRRRLELWKESGGNAVAILLSALCGSWSVGMADLSSESLLDASVLGKPLWVATSVCMARNVQERLVAFINRGGKLLLSPVIPYLDEDFQECPILRDYLGGASAEVLAQSPARLVVGPTENVLVTDRLFRSCARPAGAERTATEVYSNAEVGWTYRPSGGGTVIWLGLPWKHAMKEHSRVVGYLMELCGVERIVSCDNPNVWTTLRRKGSQALLFAMNLFTGPMEANIRVRQRESASIADARFSLRAMSVEALEVNCEPPRA